LKEEFDEMDEIQEEGGVLKYIASKYVDLMNDADDELSDDELKRKEFKLKTLKAMGKVV
jgi:hypothetical protein